MNKSVNKVILLGYVGSEIKYQFTPSGIPVATFSLATSTSWKDKNGKLIDSTEWHQLVAWQSLAELAQKLIVKGSKIYVEGKIRSRILVSNSGYKKSIFEIVMDQLILLDSPNKNNSRQMFDTDYIVQLLDNPLENSNDTDPF